MEDRGCQLLLFSRQGINDFDDSVNVTPGITKSQSSLKKTLRKGS